MKKDDLKLLFIELSARLPYGVMVAEFDENGRKISMTAPLTNMCNVESHYCDLKPYLFPMSSMTEEQKKEYLDLLYISPARGIDYLNEHMFDYRGLIEKGLAIDATKAII